MSTDDSTTGTTGPAAGFPAPDQADEQPAKAVDDTPREQRSGLDDSEPDDPADPDTGADAAPPPPAPTDPVPEPDPTDVPTVRVFRPDHTLLATHPLEQRDQAVAQARETGGYILAAPAMTPTEQARYPQALCRVDCPGHCGRTVELYAAHTDPPDDADGNGPAHAVRAAAGCLDDPPVCIGAAPPTPATPAAATLGPGPAARIATVSVPPTATTLTAITAAPVPDAPLPTAGPAAPGDAALLRSADTALPHGLAAGPARTALFTGAGATGLDDVRRVLGLDDAVTVLHTQTPAAEDPDADDAGDAES